MIAGHYGAMVVGYAAALLGWWALDRLPRSPWPVGEPVAFEHPWRETGYALLAVVGVLLVGQLYTRGLLIPESGALAPVAGALDQILIFAPVPALLVLRRATPASAWLAPGRVAHRLGAGVVLAAVALLTYSIVRAGSGSFASLAGRIVRYGNLDEAVQVLMEDVTIAVIFVRLAASIGRGRAVALTAVLFAAGHVPALLVQGDRGHEILLLARDAALGTAVVALLQRSRDILWFWCVHFVMDMTQFARITSGG